jgi:hypothetical protein
VVTKGRHDPCVGVRATPIAEAMLAIVLMDHFLRHRGQNADVVPPLSADCPLISWRKIHQKCPAPSGHFFCKNVKQDVCHFTI